MLTPLTTMPSPVPAKYTVMGALEAARAATREAITPPATTRPAHPRDAQQLLMLVEGATLVAAHHDPAGAGEAARQAALTLLSAAARTGLQD
jgi:hypothetical protein